ncbi:MAG: hypothetical protein LBF22_03530 [Deltaproteobacteria bacterium]|jgi:autotransporter-associated beta strand protein|nr:hypothetical protein [Deltaproteobacteria bacterium]
MLKLIVNARDKPPHHRIKLFQKLGINPNAGLYQYNTTMTWNSNSGGDWSGKVWTGLLYDLGIVKFGDKVVFPSFGLIGSPVAVTVDRPVHVSDMVINCNGYFKFHGSPITIAKSETDLHSPKGKLLLESNAYVNLAGLSLKAEEIDIAKNALLVLSDGASINNTPVVLNNGKLWFDTGDDEDSCPLTITGSISGSGELNKLGAGILQLPGTLSGFDGTIYHSHGTIRLNTAHGGSYVQSEHATLIMGPLASIAKSAIFKGTISGASLIVEGDVSFYNAFLKITSETGKNPLLTVKNGVTFAGTSNRILFSSFTAGSTYTIISSKSNAIDTSSIDASNFSFLTMDGETLSGRMAPQLKVDAASIKVFFPTFQNHRLTWVSQSGTWDTTPGKFTGVSNYFMDNDSVTFTDSNQGLETVFVPKAVEVSGMHIAGGNYVFTGFDINGSLTVTGKSVIPLGKLSICGSAVADFQNHVSFCHGVYISQGAKAILSEDGSFASRNILNLGTLEINKDFDFTFDNTLTGIISFNIGSLVKSGKGTLTLEGNQSSFSGELNHLTGGLRLASIWGGSYTSQADTSLEALSGAYIENDALFMGTITGENLTVGGNATFENVTIKLNPKTLGTTAPFFTVSGSITFLGNKNKIILEDFIPNATIILIANSNVKPYWKNNFKPITISGSHTGRQIAQLVFEEDLVKIEMFEDENAFLTFPAGSGTWGSAEGKLTGRS